MGKRSIIMGIHGRNVVAGVVELRAARRWSQAELATLIQATGHDLTRQSITEIETGRRRVDVDDLVAFALAFDVNPNVLLGVDP